MTHSFRVLQVAVVMTAWLAAGNVATAQEKDAPKSKGVATVTVAPAAKTKPKVKLPVAIRTAFKTAYPNAMIKKVSREKSKGKIRYEVESMDGTLARDLIYRPNGTVVEIEEVVAQADLPQPVRQAIEAKHPKDKILKAEKLRRGTTILYEIRLRVGDKKHEITFDPTGTQVKPKLETPKKTPEK